MALKIGIDISLTVGEKAGVGIYSYNLVKHLFQLDSENKYILFPFYYHIFHPDFKKAYCPDQKNFRMNLEKVPKNILTKAWSSKRIPNEWFFPKVDILHSTTFCVPKTGYKKLITTIYDVSFFTHPEFHIKENIEHCHHGTVEAVSHADRIISISNHTKKDLVNYFNCDPNKIEVIYLGAEERYKPISDMLSIEVVKSKYGIKNNYIFNLGSIEPRKNNTGLLEAYSMLPIDLRKEYKLIIGGCKGWKNSGIYKKVESLGIKEQVLFIGFVEDDDLPYLYSGATLFVYPSFYEGFGLPLLEAMSCGCPVIASNVSSMPEVVGKAGALIDPYKPDELRDKIIEILNDTSLLKKLSIHGLKQANKFSWDKCAKQTLAIYENFQQSFFVE